MDELCELAPVPADDEGGHCFKCETFCGDGEYDHARDRFVCDACVGEIDDDDAGGWRVEPTASTRHVLDAMARALENVWKDALEQLDPKCARGEPPGRDAPVRQLRALLGRVEKPELGDATRQ